MGHSFSDVQCQANVSETRTSLQADRVGNSYNILDTSAFEGKNLTDPFPCHLFLFLPERRVKGMRIGMR